MSEFNNYETNVSDSFDQDYNKDQILKENLFKESIDLSEATIANHPNGGQMLFLDYQDPLKHVHKIQFQPCIIDMGNPHFVEPHDVKGYVRQDGTVVEGYYRDGDGNTNINRTTENGGGYQRT